MSITRVFHTFCVASSSNLRRSYSLLLLALYTWNSPLPAPALDPWTFFIISRAARIVFSLGGGGINAGFAGSLRSFSNCERCFSTAVRAWRFAGAVDVEGVGLDIVCIYLASSLTLLLPNSHVYLTMNSLFLTQ